MLKCVVFAVTSYYYKYLLERRGKIEDELTAGGIELKIMEAEENPEAGLQSAAQLYKKEELLFIADGREVFLHLYEEGYYVIALYHEQNRKVSFKEALYAVEDAQQLNLKSYDEVYRRLAGLPWNILETGRLKVRESTVADVQDFYRIYEEPSVTYYMEDLFQDPDEERAYMESYIRQVYGFYGFGMWTVVLKETGQIIGRAGLSVREGYELPELGFVIAVPFQGRGYAFEVCSAVLDYAKEELLFDRVQALVQEQNAPSRKLLAKLGFTYEKNVMEDNREYRLMIKRL